MIIALILLPLSLQAGEILDALKAKPVSQYQLGVFRLEFYVSLLHQNLKGMEIANTSFKINSIGIKEKQKSISLEIKLIGNSEDAKEDSCEGIKKMYSETLNANSFIRNVWPNLMEKDYKALNEELTSQFILRSQDRTIAQVFCTPY
jgi:hypothetical protein